MKKMVLIAAVVLTGLAGSFVVAQQPGPRSNQQDENRLEKIIQQNEEILRQQAEILKQIDEIKRDMGVIKRRTS